MMLMHTPRRFKHPAIPGWLCAWCRCAGVVGAVVLPVTGIGVGTVQFVRGCMNQPEALSQQAQGKLWDEVRGWWMGRRAGPYAGHRGPFR